MSSKRRYILNIILLGVAILWPLFQSLYFGGIDSAGRIKILMTIIAIVVNGKHLFQTPKVMHIWLLWIVYSAINTYLNGFFSLGSSFPFFVHHNLIAPYIMMLVAYQVISYDEKGTVRALFVFFLLYMILGALDLNAIYFRDNTERLSNELGNEYFNTIVLLLTFTSLMYVLKRLNFLFFILIFAYLSYIAIISGERKGLIALFIIILGSYIANIGANSWRLILSYVVLVVLAYCAVVYVMGHTTFGERMYYSIENTKFADNWFLTLMGDRAPQYYEGWFVFLEHPWTGIGLHKFAEINTFWYGGIIHSEYMTQLAECGIIGSAMFIMLYIGMIKRLFKNQVVRANYPFITILRATLLAIMTINLVAWTYSNIYYFIMYGLIFGYCERLKKVAADMKLSQSYLTQSQPNQSV